jgi:hypothetical protein
MRSYYRIWYARDAGYDKFFDSESDIPDTAEGRALLSFGHLRKSQYLSCLNMSYLAIVTYWGLSFDAVPQWLYDNGGSAFQLGSIAGLNSNFGPWSPGTFYPFILYPEHPLN